MAMYLLVGSPVPWTLIDPQPSELTAERRQRYALEQQRIDGFKAGLGGAERVFAHLSCPMIFDAHDITDDWNLYAQEEATTSTEKRRDGEEDGGKIRSRWSHEKKKKHKHT